MSEHVGGRKLGLIQKLKPHKRLGKAMALSCAVGTLCASATAALAQSDTWAGNTDATWAGANWTGTNNPPLSGDSLSFGVAGTSGVNLNNNLTSSSFVVSGITFNAGAAAYVIGNGTTTANTGNAFVLGGSITNNSTSLETIDDPFNMSGASTFTTTTGGGNLTLAGVISGTGAATFSGTGISTLATHNTYSGGTTVSSGTLNLSSGGSAGTILGALNISSGATVNLTTADDLGYTAGVNVTFVNVNGGIINDASGGNEGYLTSYNLTGGSMTSTGGLFNFNTNYGITSLPSSTTSVVSGGLSLRAGAVPINVSSGSTASGVDLSMTGPISGAGPLVKSGAGVLQLSGTDTYTGATQVAGGTLLIGSGTTLTTTSGISVGTTTTPANFTVAGGTVIETGTFNMGSATGANATFTMTGGTYNYTGGTIYIDNAGAGVTTANINLSGSAVFNAPAATLVLGQYGDTANAANISTATLTMSGSSVLNANYIVLGCNNTSAYEDGIINLNGGTIAAAYIKRGNTYVAASATTEVINANGGTIQATAASTNYIAGPYVNLAGGGLTFNTSTFAVTLTNAMVGVGGLTKIGSGTLTLTGSNSYTGPTNISSGTLSLGNGSTTGSLSPASQINVSSVLTFNRSNTAVQGVDFPVITGSGSIVQAGLGTTELSASNSYTGTTSITAGVLEFANPQAAYGGNQSSWTSANILVSPGAALGIYLGTGGFTPTTGSAFLGQLLTNNVFAAGSSIALDPGSNTVTYSAAISNSPAGALGVVKAGSGTVILSASNTYTGGTNISNGTLVLGNASGLGPVGSSVVVSGTGMIGITSDSQIADANFNLSNYPVTYTAGTGISFQNYNSSLNFNGITAVRLGAALGTPSVLSGNVSGASTLTYMGLGTLTLSGAVTSSELFVRQGSLILSGTSATVNATAYSSIGMMPGDNGSLTLQNGAVFTSTSDLNISDTSGTTANTGVVTIADSASGISVANLYVGKGNAVENPVNNVGTVNQLAGNTTVSGTLVIGQYGFGTYNLSGGTFTMNGNSFTLGTEPGATGILNISGTGVLNDATTGTIYLANSGGAGTTSAINLSGNGSFNAPNAYFALGQFASSTTAVNASTATITLSGSSTLTAGTVLLGGRNNSFYTDPVINLNGGTIIAGSVVRGNTLFATSATAVVVNANGGTIQATGANTNYFNGVFINLQAGGLNFNTSSYAVTIGNAMSGVGGLTKSGTGALTLTGSNSYTGPTNVSGGALLIATDSSLPASNNVTIGRTAVLVASDQNQINSTASINVNGGIIIYGGSLQQTQALVQTGYNNGSWNGPGGIFSSAAATDSSHISAVGVIVNDDGTGSGNALYNTFEGQSTIDGDILVKYTYYGDANLDGTVDGSDYTRIDAAYLADQISPGSVAGWFNGDFNYDGNVDGSDYTLIDNAFNTQGAVVQAQFASSAAQFAGSGSSSAVPEPASLGLLGVGAALLLGRRRRSC